MRSISLSNLYKTPAVFAFFGCKMIKGSLQNNMRVFIKYRLRPEWNA